MRDFRSRRTGLSLHFGALQNAFLVPRLEGRRTSSTSQSFAKQSDRCPARRRRFAGANPAGSHQFDPSRARPHLLSLKPAARKQDLGIAPAAWCQGRPSRRTHSPPSGPMSTPALPAAGADPQTLVVTAPPSGRYLAAAIASAPRSQIEARGRSAPDHKSRTIVALPDADLGQTKKLGGV
jgi:hypothetical protein